MFTKFASIWNTQYRYTLKILWPVTQHIVTALIQHHYFGKTKVLLTDNWLKISSLCWLISTYYAGNLINGCCRLTRNFFIHFFPGVFEIVLSLFIVLLWPLINIASFNHLVIGRHWGRLGAATAQWTETGVLTCWVISLLYWKTSLEAKWKLVAHNNIRGSSFPLQNINTTLTKMVVNWQNCLQKTQVFLTVIHTKIFT